MFTRAKSRVVLFVGSTVGGLFLRLFCRTHCPGYSTPSQTTVPADRMPTCSAHMSQRHVMLRVSSCRTAGGSLTRMIQFEGVRRTTGGSLTRMIQFEGVRRTADGSLTRMIQFEGVRRTADGSLTRMIQFEGVRRLLLLGSPFSL